MASWGNQQNQPYPQDMDSNGQKLTVRNQNGPDDAAWRTVIAESDVEHPHYLQALRVLGRTELENTNASFQALRVKGKTVCESPSGTRTEPVLLADGKSELQNINTDPDPQHPEYALTVTGRAYFNRGPADNVRAAIVDGQIQLTLDGTNRGKITPNASLNSLDINAGSDSDPNVRIGSGGSIAAGNTVTIMGKQIFIGATADPGYRVAIGGPVNVSGYLRVPFVEADLEVQSPRLEPVIADGILDIGTRQAHQVLIGRGGPLHPTDYTICNTKLTVSGLVEIADRLLVSGGNIDTNGTVNAASVETSGDITAQGSITAVGDISANGSIAAGNTVRVDGDVEAGGVMSCQGAVMAGALESRGALRVDGESIFASEVTFHSHATMQARTYHEDEVHLQGHPIILSSEGDKEVKIMASEGRCEFYIDGELKFYIDQEGGHNA